MGVDYYNTLKVSKTSTDDELRKSYKKLVMKWHPDKHPNLTKLIAESKFKQICEAYDVLSDAQKRQIYDVYGEEGLKSGDRDAETVFAEFLRSGSRNLRSDGGSGGKKVDALETLLACSLEELYRGSKRKMKISRIVSDDFGKPMTVEEVLTVDIKPGWKKGTKITFPEKGNQYIESIPGDLIFVIDEKPHSVFKRDGNDLIINQKISLLDALTGKNLNLTSLDGRNLSFGFTEIVRPGQEIVVENEGMPISKDPSKKGNLRIRFDINFPKRLSDEQKSNLRRVLG